MMFDTIKNRVIRDRKADKGNDKRRREADKG